VACYTAKEMGRNRVHVYHEKEAASVQRHVEILQAAGLRDALEMERFCLYCQPIVPLHEDKPDAVHYEVLLRLRDENGDISLPGAFIPAAERFNLMPELDRWVIRTAFRNYRELLANRNARISVNLSGNSLNDESLIDFVSHQFKEFSLPPHRVCFEITETAAVTDLSRAGRFIFEVQKLGSELALDDFGSGLSSLRYLKALPIDYLKIDGSFIQDIDRDSGNQAIVAAVNQLAHHLGIRTIGEYAATAQIVEALLELDVDYAQGFALGVPVPFSTEGLESLKEDQ
jgi:EAL domain-containing protein (putative c-di-GMP-specific phosphodiesterase class I)